MKKFVILQGIEHNNIFWTINTENNCFSQSGKLWYKELSFSDTEEEAIKLYEKAVTERNNTF
jgi:hypothetical protein